MLPKLETRNLAFKLTQEEIIDRAKKLAMVEDELIQLEVKRKMASDEFKDLKKDLDSKRRTLSRAVVDGQDFRPTDCEWKPDWKKNEKQLIRLDTNEIVSSITMTAEDLQRQFNFMDGTESSEKPRKRRKT